MNLPRDKSEKQIEITVKNLIILINALDEHKVRYFVDSGTLLGMYRDKKLIPWDWDVELSMTEEEYDKKKNIILNIIDKLNFKIIKINEENKKIDIEKDLDRSINKYSIKVWKLNKKKEMYFRNNFEIPKKFFENICEISCYKRKFNSPCNVEEYLEYMYGDWRKPVKSLNKSAYLSKNFYKKNYFFKIKRFIFKFFD